MASISNDPNGRRRILFVGADGKRKPIRLGKVSLRHAESVKVKVEDLVSASITGHPPADETTRWLGKLDASLYDKLARVGLTQPRESATLAEFTRNYIDSRSDVKPGTIRNLEQCRAYLLECFDEAHALRAFTAGDAEDFRLHMVRTGRADNTTRRAIGRARQFFTAAKRRGLIQENPFEGIPASVRANTERFYFISRREAQRVLDACPDAQWRLIFALARFGGLRCPSEVLALTWDDVNWEQNRIRVPSPKTEHNEGGGSRIIPLFPELRPHLLEAFDEAEPGTQYVITRCRDSRTNLRTQMHRIIRRAGLEPWPKTFQNLRSTRETELAEQFPMHVICKWIGNSQPVAAQHYLQLTDEHFERAIEPAAVGGTQAAQNAAQQPHEATGNGTKPTPLADPGSPVSSGDFSGVPAIAGYFTGEKAPRRGFEPLLPG